jgi:hypothetical protein
VADRQQAAERLAYLKVPQADVNAQRARVTAEAGPVMPTLAAAVRAVMSVFTMAVGGSWTWRGREEDDAI